MSNLTDLLPAGAGGKQVSFVASGTIGNGVTVALKSDGTVEAVAFAATSAGSAVSIVATGGQGGNVVSVYDSANDKVVVFYNGAASSYYMTAVVGTVSGSSISFGTPVVTSIQISYSSACYDAQAQKIVYVGRISTGLTARVITVSGTTVSVGAQATIRSGSGAADLFYNAVAYDSDNQKVVAMWRDTASTNYNTYASIGTVSGTTISFTSPQVVDNSNQNSGCGITYSSEESVVLMSWTSGYRAYVKAATSNGSTLTFGTTVQLSASNADGPSFPVYDPVSGKMVVLWMQWAGTNMYFQTVGVSGTTLTAGTITTRSGTYSAYYKMERNQVDNKIYAVVLSSASPQDAIIHEITISGSTATLDSGFEYVTDSSPTLPYYNTMAIDTSSNKVVAVYAPGSSYSALDSKVITPAGSNNTDFIGITDAAISDTASGSVTIKGGISTNATGLTPNALYYVQDDGSLSTTASSVLAGKALSSTSINLDYTT